jgi:hypothetical protein
VVVPHVLAHHFGSAKRGFLTVVEDHLGPAKQALQPTSSMQFSKELVICVRINRHYSQHQICTSGTNCPTGIVKKAPAGQHNTTAAGCDVHAWMDGRVSMATQTPVFTTEYLFPLASDHVVIVTRAPASTEAPSAPPVQAMHGVGEVRLAIQALHALFHSKTFKSLAQQRTSDTGEYLHTQIRSNADDNKDRTTANKQETTDLRRRGPFSRGTEPGCRRQAPPGKTSRCNNSQ